MKIEIIISGVSVAEVAELKLRNEIFLFGKNEGDCEIASLIWSKSCDNPQDIADVGHAIERLTACFVEELPPEEKWLKKTIKLDSTPDMINLLNRKIRELNIDKAIIKLLEKEYILCIRDLVIKKEEDLLGLDRMGVGKLNKIRTILYELGLDIGINPDEYPEIF